MRIFTLELPVCAAEARPWENFLLTGYRTQGAYHLPLQVLKGQRSVQVIPSASRPAPPLS